MLDVGKCCCVYIHDAWVLELAKLAVEDCCLLAAERCASFLVYPQPHASGDSIYGRNGNYLFLMLPSESVHSKLLLVKVQSNNLS